MKKQNYKEILKKLSLEEKAYLCAQKDGSFGRIERLGLKGNVPQDNPRNGDDYFRSGMGENDGKYHPVAFPPVSSLGMSWDTDLAYKVGKAIAIEGKANPEKVTWIFRPGVNIKRSPLCGRNFEYISEDPVASGELAAAYIQGMQSEGVAATLKHYVCNNQEFERMTTNSVVSERALREVYLKPFEIAIKKGKPWSVMTSYNQVNGDWVNSNSHLMDILRKDFGYDGVVVSDFAAIHHNKLKSHQNRLDIELAPNDIHSEELIEAVRSGQIDERLLDEAVENVLKLCERLEETPACEADMESLHEQARVAAEKSIVLLENNGILPLDANKKEEILVVGGLAMNPSYMGGGSGHMNGYRIDQPLDEICKCTSAFVKFVKGYETPGGFPPVDEMHRDLMEEAVEQAKCADKVIVFAGLQYCYESEGYDRDNIFLPESQRVLLDKIMQVNKNIILVASCGSVLDLSAYKGKVSAIIYTGLAGEAFGGAIANIIFGKAEPGGRLTETFPMCLEHTPAELNFATDLTDMPNVIYGEDVFVGYRWYEARKLPVAYPFGYGLSYTRFEISNFKVSKKVVTPEDEIEISVHVKNVGDRPGSQVIQLYVGDEKSIVKRPVKELKAFEKVYLKPGEEKRVVMNLGQQDFAFFSEKQNKWVVENGIFDIHVGTSVRDIVYEETIEMTNGNQSFVYTKMTPLVWFMKSPKFMELIRREFSEELYNMLRPETYEWACLIAPLPFYKMKETYLGKSLMTEEEINYILTYMNNER